MNIKRNQLKNKTMANMSYCRFENTLGDLQDCHEALENIYEEIQDMSTYEKQSLIPFIELCKEIANEFELEDIQELIDQNEDEGN
tara:strand:- start:171 stop:425 length:255 start_codon:yes stop_codon:yes gene_type:complete